VTKSPGADGRLPVEHSAEDLQAKQRPGRWGTKAHGMHWREGDTGQNGC
jgi:hypothetical protein